MKKYCLVFFPIFFVLVVTAVIVRFSYTDIGIKYYDYPYEALISSDEKSDIKSINKYSNYEEIFKKSDLIVKCKVIPKRKITDIAFYTPVEVESVYKGDSKLASQHLDIIENVRVTFDNKILFSMSGYVPLQENETYVLCLTKKDWDQHKNLSTYENSQYYITSDSAFGVFRANNIKQVKTFNENSKETINTLKGIDVLAGNEDVLDEYYKLKDELFKNYNISH